MKKQLKFDTVAVIRTEFAPYEEAGTFCGKRSLRNCSQITPLVSTKRNARVIDERSECERISPNKMIEERIAKKATCSESFLKKARHDFAVPVATPLSDYLKVFFIEFNNYSYSPKIHARRISGSLYASQTPAQNANCAISAAREGVNDMSFSSLAQIPLHRDF